MESKNLTYGGIDVTVSHLVLTPEGHWNNRYERFLSFQKCKERFGMISEEERVAIVKSIKEAIEQMYDSVEEWLPESFTAFEPGQAIRIEYNLLVMDIDEDLHNSRKAISLKARDAACEMLEELFNED